jgi:hypothetical protein
MFVVYLDAVLSLIQRLLIPKCLCDTPICFQHYHEPIEIQFCIRSQKSLTEDTE